MKTTITKAFLVIVTIMISHLSTNAKPVTQQAAHDAGKHWLDANPKRVTSGNPKKIRIQREVAFNNSKIRILELDDSGYIIVASDDSINPIVAFSASGHVGTKTNDPLLDIIRNHVPKNIAIATKRDCKKLAIGWTQPTSITTSTTKATIDDIRVFPLLKTTWSQGQDSQVISNKTIDDPVAFNYYTPPYANGTRNNYLCGCVATAMAQTLYYHQWPTFGIGKFNKKITVNNITQTATTRGGDDNGGPYQWSAMATNIAGASINTCKAIGRLTWDTGVTVSMDYESDGSGAYSDDIATALTLKFKYSQAINGISGSGLMEQFTTILESNLEADLPVILTISGDSGAHEIVCDGYGYYNGVLYHHLNLGWEGYGDVWYNLPDISGTDYSFALVNDTTYNIMPKTQGEVISGRVTTIAGEPVANATITATIDGTKNSYQTKTKQNGVWGIIGVPSTTTLNIIAKNQVYTSQQQTITTAKSTSQTCGNVTKINLQLEQPKSSLIPQILIQPQATNIIIQGSTINLTVTTKGTNLTYQWYVNNTLLPGKTSSNLQITNSTRQNEGDYYITIQNAMGQITSQIANVIVVIPPQIIQNAPSNILAETGANVSITPITTGNRLIAKWSKNGIDYGANTTSLVFPSAVTSNSGTYQVTITNEAGSITSSLTAVLIVQPIIIDTLPPSITLTPDRIVTDNNNICITGRAFDNVAVNTIICKLGANSFTATTANNWTNWSAKIYIPTTGTYQIAVTGQDINNNWSETTNITVTVKQGWLDTHISGNWNALAMSANGQKVMAISTLFDNVNYPASSIWTSLDGGNTWTNRPTALAVISAITACNDGSKVIALATQLPYETVVNAYLSTNFGISWNPLTNLTFQSSANTPYTCAISGDGNTFVIGAPPTSAYISKDNGNTWTASIYPTGGVGYDMATTAVTEDGQTLVFAPKDSQIVISTNCGMNWTMEQSSATAWNQCACSWDGKEIVVTSPDDNTMYEIATISHDAGKTWTAIAPNDQAGNGAVACSRDGQVIGIINETVLASTNSGSSWFSTTPGDYSTPVGKNGQLAISADGNKWVVAGHDESIKILTLNLRPTIEIAHSTNGVKLQWTVPSSPIIIEQSSDFVNWTQIENSCETIGAKQYLSIEPSNKMFYRLGK